MTPIDGRIAGMSHRMCPSPRDPTSITKTSASSGVDSTVSGTPTSLLYECGEAHAPGIAPASRSFVVQGVVDVDAGHKGGVGAVFNEGCHRTFCHCITSVVVPVVVHPAQCNKHGSRLDVTRIR
jgi:hypothetical protein